MFYFIYAEGMTKRANAHHRRFGEGP